MGKVQEIVKKSNELYEKFNTYKNTKVPQVDALMAAFGIGANGDISHLDETSRKALYQTIIPIQQSIALEESIGRGLEGEIVSMGYASLAAMLADLPNLFAGNTLSVVQRNFTGTIEIVTYLGTYLDDPSLEGWIIFIIGLRNRIVEFCTGSNLLPKVDEV